MASSRCPSVGWLTGWSLLMGLCLCLRATTAAGEVEAIDEEEATPIPTKVPAPRELPNRDEDDDSQANQESSTPLLTIPTRPDQNLPRPTPVVPRATLLTPPPAAAIPVVSTTPVIPRALHLVLPTETAADLLWHFRARQRALSEQNAQRAQLESAAILDLRPTLDFPELFSCSAAICREGEHALGSRLGAQALESASLAIELAPGQPAGWWLLARATIAVDGLRGLGKALGALGQALTNEVTEPRYLRSNVGNLLISALCASLLAGGATLLLLLGMALPYARHDFHHLFPRAASPVQTGILAIILLAIPWVFKFGPFAALASSTAAIWIYLQARERAAAILALAFILMVPPLLGWVARWAVLPALSSDLYTVELDLDSGPEAARLAALAARPDPPLTVLFALAHRAKRLGNLPQAERLYRAALAVAPGRGDVANNLGNVLFLKGDFQGAQRLHERAIEGDPGMAAAYFNLSQDFDRLLRLDESQRARKHALELDRPLIERHLVGGDLRANQYLIDRSLTWSEIIGGGAVEVEQGVRSEASAWLMGPLESSWEFATAALLVLFLGLSVIEGRLRPSTRCLKCGRPVCTRCDHNLPGDGLCGQCVNLAGQRPSVDPKFRRRKAQQIKAHQATRTALVRILAVTTGGAGQIATGQPLLGLGLCWIVLFLGLNAFGGADLLRAPLPGLGLPRLILFGLLLLPPYLLSVHAAFRRG